MAERDEALFERLTRDVYSDWPDRLLHDLSQAPIVDEAAATFANDYTSAVREDLSDREIEVLQYASYGLEANHIADTLFVSVETVKTHLKAARFRLKAKNTAHACCLALRQGLFE